MSDFSTFTSSAADRVRIGRPASWPALPRFTKTPIDPPADDSAFEPSLLDKTAISSHEDADRALALREDAERKSDLTSFLPPTAKAPSRGRVNRRSPAATKPLPKGGWHNRKITLQLIASLVIFGFCLILKVVSPQSARAVKEAITDGIGRGIDYKATLETLGRALSGEGEISAVFDVISAGIFAGTGTSPENSSVDDPDGVPAPVDILPPDAGMQQPVSQSTFSESAPDTFPVGWSSAGQTEKLRDAVLPVVASTERMSSDFGTGAVVLSNEAFPFSQPLVLSGWEFALNEADANDDTLPIPFATTLPEKADYTFYPPPFSYITPLLGHLTSSYGFRTHPVSFSYKFHYGVDIGGPEGTDISSFADGVVTECGEGSEAGLYVKIDHGNDFYSYYAHCSKLYVTEGQTVKMGQRVAAVGQTGNATGPHLHFEILYKGKHIDPTKYLSFPATA